MANRTASIVVRTRGPKRNWVAANGKTDPPGTYYIRWCEGSTNRFAKAGANYAEAEVAQLRMERKLNAALIGAVYDTHSAAENAIKELQKSGFDMKKLSVVGKDFHTDEQVIGYYNAGDRMKYWGKMGAFWGGIWGLLFGAAFFWVPGVGPLLVAGPLAAWIVGALEGAVVVGGLSALGAGLYSIGIPKNSVLKYETAIKADKFVLVAHGTTAEAAKAKDILAATQPAELDQHTLESCKAGRKSLKLQPRATSDPLRGTRWFSSLMGLDCAMKILLAVDGSKFSAAVTQAVISEVKREGAEIQTIHVVDTRKELLSEMKALDAEVMNAPAQRRFADALVETSAELVRDEGLKATTAVVWGDPRSQIIDVAKNWRADLIVLGSHGRTGLKGFTMGSVSDAVVHHAPCSVEIVRVPKRQLTPQGLRILLAMDDSKFSEAAADAVISQIKPKGTEVTLLSVFDPFPVAEAEKMASNGYPEKEYPDFVRAREDLRDQAKERLPETAEKLQTVGFKVTETIVKEGDARDIILDCADRWEADLIVVGSHRRKGIKRFLMGSVSEAVSRYAACSVEIVRLQSNQ